MEAKLPSDQEIESLCRTLRTFVRRRGLDEHATDDVVQEAWLRTLRRGPRAGGLRNWMHVVAARLVFELRRSQRHRHQREESAARAPLVAERAAQEESVVLRAVHGLPEPYREVLRLRFVEEREVVEIAALLQRSEATVRSQLKRGLDRVRLRLGDQTAERNELWLPSLLLFWRRAPSAPLGGLSPAACAGLAVGVSLAFLGTQATWQAPAPAALVVHAFPPPQDGPARSAVPALSAPPAVELRQGFEPSTEEARDSGTAPCAEEAAPGLVRGHEGIPAAGSTLLSAPSLEAPEEGPTPEETRGREASERDPRATSRVASMSTARGRAGSRTTQLEGDLQPARSRTSATADAQEVEETRALVTMQLEPTARGLPGERTATQRAAEAQSMRRGEAKPPALALTRPPKEQAAMALAGAVELFLATKLAMRGAGPPVFAGSRSLEPESACVFFPCDLPDGVGRETVAMELAAVPHGAAGHGEPPRVFEPSWEESRQALHVDLPAGRYRLRTSGQDLIEEELVFVVEPGTVQTLSISVQRRLGECVSAPKPQPLDATRAPQRPF